MNIKTYVSSLFVVISLLFNCSTQAQWIEIDPIPDPMPGQNYTSVDFIDSLNGWITGNRGVIIHTSDGGNHWIQQESGINFTINKIKFASLQMGWAVADSGKILHSSDGGNTWLIQSSGNRYWNMKYISAIDEFSAWAVGNFFDESTNILLHTEDGGAYWDTLSSNLNPSHRVSDIFFINQYTGWYCASDGYTYKTQNGGQNWFQQLVSWYGTPRSIFFTDINHGWCVGNEILCYTTNGGATWVSTGNYDQRSFTDVYFNDDNIGWLVENIYNGYPVASDIKFTSDHGQTMVHQYNTPYNFFIYDICFIEQRIGWAAVSTNGEDGFLVHTTNGGGKFPSPPQLIFPVNNQQVNPDSVNFIWSPTSANIINYSINISTDSIFTNCIDTLVADTNLILTNLEPGKNYYWRSKARNSIGWSGYSNIAVFNTGTTEVTENQINENRFSLSQNYPNPFNPTTNIEYRIPYREHVTLKIYDILGNEVAILVNEEKPAGSYSVEFNGNKLSSGIYFYQLKAVPIGRQAGTYTATKKLILLR